MSPSWSWDFEDEPRPRSEGGRVATPTEAGQIAAPDAGPSAPPAAAGQPPRRTIQIRRRRAGAALLGIALIVAIVAAATGSGSSQPRHSSSSSSARLKAAKRAPTNPERQELAAVSSVLGYTQFVREGGARGRDIALTFDDGPGPYTPQVLSVLERFHAPATFFTIGKMLRYFGASTVREIEDGDAIGDHTESHPALARLSAHDQNEQLFETIVRIELLGAHRPVLFRPPYGSFNATTMSQLARLHLLMVLWSVDTGDYLQPGVSVIVERALAGAHPGAIVLMHDAGGVRSETIEALPLIIKGLRAKGYNLVTVPRLLADDPPPAGQPLPKSLNGD